MLNKRFTAVLQKHRRKGSWTYVVWPESVRFFRTRGIAKIRETIDGHPFRSSFMAMGNGKHMLPVRSEIRRLIGKEAGAPVTVHLQDRIDSD